MTQSKNKPIISIFIHCFPPARGGLEYLTGEIKKILDSKYEVHIITGQGLNLDSYKTFSNFTDNSSNNIHRLELNYFWQRIANKFLNKIIFKIGFFSPYYFGPILKYTPEVIDIIKKSDLIIGAGMPTKMFYDSYLFAKKYNKKLICLPAYHNVSYYNHCYFFQKVFSYVDKILFLTQFEKNQLIKNYLIDKSKLVQSTFCPFTKKQIKTQQKKLSATIKQHQNNIKNKQITLGYIGQITLRKNLYIFKDLLDAKYQVIFAGAKTNSSSDIEKYFEPYLKSNKLKIIYDFPESDKKNIYSQFDVFINPSIEESFGIVNIESIFYGLPTFVNRQAAFSEFINPVYTFTSTSGLIKSIQNNFFRPNLQYQLFHKLNYDSYKSNLQQILRSIIPTKI